MKPYYSSGGIKLYHGDCLKILPKLHTQADLIITDPPYGMKYSSNWNTKTPIKIKGDKNQSVAIEGLALAIKCLKPKRHLYIFGRYDLSQLPLSVSAELIWDKIVFSGGNLESPFAKQHDYIQFAAYRSGKVEQSTRSGLAARLRRGTILRYQRPNSNRHPTEKPAGLIRELIESSSIIGETILDPFSGVGSTLEAAYKEDRYCVGIEIEEKYCEITAKRLEEL